jgi:putative transposase
LIAAEKANFPIALMCRVLGVCRSGYYAWCRRPPSKHTLEDAALSRQIQHIHTQSRGSYGSPRVQAALRAAGQQVGRHRVARLMKTLGLYACRKRKFRLTTDSNHGLSVSENLLCRQFSVPQPDVAWVSDLTYIWTGEGWLYLAVVIDLFSRRVLGWSMAEHMQTELVLTALQAALGQRSPSHAGLIFHSDRGSQYASLNFRAALSASGLTSSMSRRANCWDNAVAESFFGTLKTELIHLEEFANRATARTTIAEWIEVFYNRQRLHSTIGYFSPVQFEKLYWGRLSKHNAA